MKPPSAASPPCSEILKRLSAYLDGELSALEALGMRHHLKECGTCRGELEELADLSSYLRSEGRQVPPSPAWEAVERRLAARVARQQAAWWSRQSTPRLVAMAAALAAVVGIGVVFQARQSQRPDFLEGARARRGAPVEIQAAGLPGLGSFLEAHRATEIPPAALESELHFRPRVPPELPGGFRLEKAYLIQDRCCAGSCLIYRRGDELVSLVQLPAAHPLSWNAGDLEDCTVEGLDCRRSSGREIEVLQIEPRGRNLTLVARPGSIDATQFVRQLGHD